MPKGRLHNPSTEKDGRWFPQLGTNNTLPMTSSREMFYHSKCHSVEEQRLPRIHPRLLKYKPDVQHVFPFSFHDNRHTLQGSAEYFDFGFGLKKVSSTKRLHSLQNVNVYCHDPLPKFIGEWDGFTNYQLSHTGCQGLEQTFHRRFPKNYK